MYVFGKNVAKELLKTNNNIKLAYLVENFDDLVILGGLKNKGVRVNYLPKKDMDRLERGNHQGVILEVEDFKYLSESDMLDNLPQKPLIVILDHLEDPHNFGAIIRTCEAAGADYIVIPKDRSVSVNKTVMKTSAGAVNNVKIVMVTNLNNTIKKLKKLGVWMVGTDMNNSLPFDEIDYDVPIGLIIGSEGFGMSKLVKQNCDFIARIPMNGRINSLNASVAAGIMIYEVIRQRK
ncbi:MAG: 23S rRNA (guanosine(2251)-2'-O)-methyltransferase RlmB [Bacilli bacterium]|nr:23S rRNA (guanosine(2251)-2'-O)-methyltransferase RlmB [Bacilli bacterium]